MENLLGKQICLLRYICSERSVSNERRHNNSSEQAARQI